MLAPLSMVLDGAANKKSFSNKDQQNRRGMDAAKIQKGTRKKEEQERGGTRLMWAEAGEDERFGKVPSEMGQAVSCLIISSSLPHSAK